MASCGGTVQAAPASGASRARQGLPKSGSRPTQHVSRGLIAPAKRAARSAEIGITVTTAPAWSGSSRQPLMSRITSRKSAATSAPETSIARRLPEVRPLQWSKRGREADSIERRQRQQEQRRLHDEDRLPPEQLGEDPARSSPHAAPRIPAKAQIRAAGASAPIAAASSPSAAQTTAAPATPWTVGRRRARRTKANAHVSEAAAKTTAPAAKTGVARRRATNAAGSARRGRLNESAPRRASRSRRRTAPGSPAGRS